MNELIIIKLYNKKTEKFFTEILLEKIQKAMKLGNHTIYKQILLLLLSSPDKLDLYL